MEPSLSCSPWPDHPFKSSAIGKILIHYQVQLLAQGTVLDPSHSMYVLALRKILFRIFLLSDPGLFSISIKLSAPTTQKQSSQENKCFTLFWSLLNHSQLCSIGWREEEFPEAQNIKELSRVFIFPWNFTRNASIFCIDYWILSSELSQTSPLSTEHSTAFLAKSSNASTIHPETHGHVCLEEWCSQAWLFMACLSCSPTALKYTSPQLDISSCICQQPRKFSTGLSTS